MALRLKDGVPAEGIRVDTRNGVVTLSGTVEDELTRSRAVQTARRVRGVRGVVNDLRVGERVAVSPGAWDLRTDRDILREILSNLRRDPGVDESALLVRVARGQVVISGTVRHGVELARLREAASVRGVRSIDTVDVKVGESSTPDF